ncbi:hypothetical protein [Bradyrhizobium sp. SYSU BS000235]|uniref:hypothetical protein n=1 Tax=Bradyrhizobium sp. SYSU BS000235 TaxID=3411332 RepID=UPI003C751B32
MHPNLQEGCVSIDFKSEFDQMCTVLRRAPISAKIADEELCSLLGEILLPELVRIESSEKNLDLERATEGLGPAIAVIDEIRDTLDCSGHSFLEKVNIEFNHYQIDGPVDAPSMLGILERSSSDLKVLRRAIIDALGNDARQIGRSRPQLKYDEATAALMKLWVMLTGRNVASPKGAAKDGSGAIQPSTEFVRLGLQIIDPKSTTANAITSIRKIQTRIKSKARIQPRHV